jgi:hypothetical protein
VVWEDGSPAAGAEIKLFDMAFPGFYAGCSLVENRDKVEDPNLIINSASFNLSGPACNLKSDANGKFALSGFTGRTYRLSASVRRTLDGQKSVYEGESLPFSPGTDASDIKLVLRKK